MSEVHQSPPPAAYIAGDTPLYAQTASFGVKFNRLLIYRSCLLPLRADAAGRAASARTRARAGS